MNNLSMVIQAILYMSDKPLSGYDIAKVIKTKTGNSHQQVYRELGKLSDHLDVKVTEVPQEDKPDKKLYELLNKKMFAFETNNQDFSKCKLGYSLLIKDVVSGTDYFDAYMAELNEVANKYKELVK